MDTFITTVKSYASPEFLIILFSLSVVVFVGTLIAIPAILIRLPADYFADHNPGLNFGHQHPLLRAVLHVLKNAFGIIFFFAGVAMLVLPGQGILTMLIGISLMDFPGKRKLERRLISIPAVLQSVNALRSKFGKPPFTLSIHA